MDLKYYLIFTSSITTLSVLVFLITKRYLENKNNNNTEKDIPKDDENQIAELKGAVSQLSRTIEERLGNFGSSIGNSLNQQTESTQKSLMEMHARLAVIDRAQENINSLSNKSV